MSTHGSSYFQTPDLVTYQRLRTKVLEIFNVFHGLTDISAIDLDLETTRLKTDPLAFCTKMNTQGDEPRVTVWQWPGDARREVMLPPGHVLLIQAHRPFHCQLIQPDDKVVFTEKSLPGSSGNRFFALVSPIKPPRHHTHYRLRITVFKTERCVHAEASVLCLSKPENARVLTVFQQKNT